MSSALRLPEAPQDDFITTTNSSNNNSSSNTGHVAAPPVEPLSPTARLFEHAPGDASPSSRWQHPPSFYCPISQQCMHDPVVLADGHTYERRYIERWLEHHRTSPVSGLLLPQKDMFPNHALRNAIEEYFQQVFSVHRRAIRQSITGPGSVEGFRTNTPLLRTIDALMQCSLLMNADLCIERVLRRIMDEAKTLVGAEVASVFLLDANQRELYSTVNSTGDVIRVPVSKGIAGHVASTGEPEIIFDAYSDARFNKSVDAKTGFTTRNIMCVPLKVKKGQVIGVVQLVNKCGPPTFHSDADRFGSTPNTTDFTADDLQFLQVFASQAATAIVNSRSEEEQSGAGSPTSVVADAGTSSKPSSPGGSRTMDSLKMPESLDQAPSSCCPEETDKEGTAPTAKEATATTTTSFLEKGEEQEASREVLLHLVEEEDDDEQDVEEEEDQEEASFTQLPSRAHSEPAMSMAHRFTDNGDDTDVSIPTRTPLRDDDDGHEQDIEDAEPSSSNIKRRSLSRRRISTRERSAKRVEIQLRRRWADLEDHSDDNGSGADIDFNFHFFEDTHQRQQQTKHPQQEQQLQQQQQQHRQWQTQFPSEFDQQLPSNWKGSMAAFMQASMPHSTEEYAMTRANTFCPDHHLQHADDEGACHRDLPPTRPKRRLHSRQLAAQWQSQAGTGRSDNSPSSCVVAAETAVAPQPPSSSGATLASTATGSSCAAAAAAAAAPCSSTKKTGGSNQRAPAVAAVAMRDDPSSGSGLRSGPQSDDTACTVESGDAPQARKRKSGRTRQRVAKWWAKVRARTPSPEAGVMSMCSSTLPHSQC